MTTKLQYPAGDSVRAIETCALRVGNAEWRYAADNGDAIESAWRQALQERPGYFNGAVHLLDQLAFIDDTVLGRLLRTDFKSYLYWRQQGFPETGVLDGFGSALIRSCDGAILLGRQRAGNVNAGLAYLPGGFIDARDVDAEGHIDIAASIVRELAEETGLTPESVAMQPGFLVTQTQAHVSIAKTFVSALDAPALQDQISRYIALDATSELDAIIVVRAPSDLDGLAMPHYARVVVSAVLSNEGRGL